MRLGQLTMEEFVTKFVNLQRYVPYLKDEKTKVYRFISCLPPAYKDNIEFDMPKTMDKAIRKAKLCYRMFKQRSELNKTWKNKKNEKRPAEERIKPYPFRKGTRSYSDNNYNRPSSTTNNGTKGTRTFNSGGKNNSKEIKCWGCNGPHL